MCSQILVSVLSQLHPPKFQSLPGWVNFWSFIREYVSINSLSIHPSISIYHSLFSYLYLISFCYLRLYLYIYVYTQSRWWFQTFFMLNLTWGNNPIWLIFFKWAETTNQQYIHHSHVPLLPPLPPSKPPSKKQGRICQRQVVHLDIGNWYLDGNQTSSVQLTHQLRWR